MIATTTKEKIGTLGICRGVMRCLVAADNAVLINFVCDIGLNFRAGTTHEFPEGLAETCSTPPIDKSRDLNNLVQCGCTIVENL